MTDITFKAGDEVAHVDSKSRKMRIEEVIQAEYGSVFYVCSWLENKQRRVEWFAAVNVSKWKKRSTGARKVTRFG